jgi:hypothetical protein
MEMQKQAMIAQQQLKSQELAGQTAMQKIQAESQMKMQLKQTEISLEIEKLKVEAQLKQMLMQQEFSYSMQLSGIKEEKRNEIEKEKEKAKKDRISIQNTQQSKLINQRKNNLPPVNFESNEDSLDGFDLGEFEPR